MNGVIVKGIAGFYYVYVSGNGIYECKAKGIFRKDKKKPLVGDRCSIDVLDNTEKLGNIIEIFDRDNELIRPNVANVNQALVVFAVKHPEPNYVVLDKILLQFAAQGLSSVICFNKCDLITDEEIDALKCMYSGSGCELLFTSTKSGIGIEELKNVLLGKVTTVAGPSGVGKSSLINSLQSEVRVETGSISKKAERGKHTTRCSEIIPVSDETYLIDTPGFSSFDVFNVEYENLKDFYDEFTNLSENCRFQPCSHIHEPDCKVKECVEAGMINRTRYENYKYIYDELKSRRKY